LNLVNHLIRNPKILDCVPTNIALRHPPKLITILGGANNLPEVDVHPRVAVHQVPIIGLAVLELHEHGMPLGGLEEREGKHLERDPEIEKKVRIGGGRRGAGSPPAREESGGFGGRLREQNPKFGRRVRVCKRGR
jgi:hypothetical protein